MARIAAACDALASLMGLAHTTRKILSGDALKSSVAMIRRLRYPLNPQRFIDNINAEALDAIKAKYFNPNDKVTSRKYLDLDEWMSTNTKRIRDAMLRPAPPRKRVLDIGCGTGYFLHIARTLGHDVLGMDIPGHKLFDEVCGLLQLPRCLHTIKPWQKLPELGAPFDLVSAHMTCFNRYEDGRRWGPDEWAFFLDDLQTRLTPTGVIHMDLNAEQDGSHMAPALRQFFIDRGAKVDRRKFRLVPGR